MKSRSLVILVLVAAVLVYLQLGLFFLYLYNKNYLYQGKITKQEIGQENQRYLRSFSMSENFFDEAYEMKRDVPAPVSQPLVGIVPHHLLVKDGIAGYFENLKPFDYQVVVLLGPDHFGKTNVPITTRLNWDTPYGVVSSDKDIINQLGIRLNDEPFGLEHSISSLVPFIKKSLPRATLVPIIIPRNLSEDQAAEIALKINNLLVGKQALVLASIDFSHYLTVAAADFHDDRTENIIKTFDFDRLPSAEIDAPGTASIVLHYAQLVEANQAVKVLSSNSGHLLNSLNEPTTSHQYYYFLYGNIEEKKVVNLLFFGDIMLDRGVKELINKHGLELFFEKIKGEEGRFFKGVDLIGANLEGAVTNNAKHYPPEQENDFAFMPTDLAILKKFNFSFFNLANNHFYDQGKIGVKETRENLNQLGFNYSGCPNSELGDCSTKLLNLAGKRIALVGLNATFSSFSEAKAMKLINTLKDEVDFIVVNIHWGQEYSLVHTHSQELIAKSLEQAGAGLVIGHHPHVIEEVTVLGGTPVVYSLGNFIFDQFFSEQTQIGLAAGAVIEFNSESNGEVVKLYLFPFKTVNFMPEFLDSKEKQDLFSRIILDASSIIQNY